ncbi:MAG: hypothetical protein ABSH34_17385 [Verrucomicrobiota bacterium]|jgi:hypothetical protein
MTKRRIDGPHIRKLPNEKRDKKRQARVKRASDHTRTAHRRALKVAEKMNAREGFQSLVAAGIITPAGKVSPRYGG